MRLNKCNSELDFFTSKSPSLLERDGERSDQKSIIKSNGFWVRANKNIISFFSLTALLFIFGCDSNRVFDQNVEIKDHNWNKDQVANLEVDITDTLSRNNFYINLRNGNTYAYSNIYLFVNTKLPNGKVSRDTMELILADAEGKWQGKKSGDIIDNRILLKRGVVFPVSGKYIFEIEQGMRVDKLADIYDVGLRIEKME